MLRRIWLLTAVAVCLAGQSLAGAWPREHGTGFAVASVRLAWPQEILLGLSAEAVQDYRTLYVEYGLTDRLTLGLDLGRSVTGDDKTVLFLQMPLRNRERGPKIAVQLGFGTIAQETILRPGLSVGWGLEHGWASLDAVAEVGMEGGLQAVKADLTWGRNLGDNKLIVQLQIGDPGTGMPFARIAPSWVMSLTDRIAIETGATYGLHGDGTVGIKLGLWTTF